MINIRYLNQLREHILKRDKINDDCFDKIIYDENVFILKGALEKFLRISPRLPYCKIKIIDNTSKICSSIKFSEYEIKYGLNSIDNYKKLLINLFKDNTDVYKYYPFNFYISSREELIALLFQYGLEYIFFHEYAHIKDGHLKFIENNQQYKANTDLMCTLEYHADNSAICTILGIYEINNFHNTIEEKIINATLICVAAYLQLSMIKHKDYIWDILDVEDFENAKDTIHPLYGFRQYSIFNSVKGKLDKIYSDKAIVEAFMERLSIAIRNTERARQGCENIYQKRMPMLLTLTKAGHDALKKIHNTWKWGRKLIEPYSYMNLCEFGEWVNTEIGYFIDVDEKKKY